MKQKDENCARRGDDWDVITATVDGGFVWRRYRDRRIFVTHGEETPDQALDRMERRKEEASSASAKPAYAPSDFVKVEFTDEGTGVGEWMWLRVDRCDDESRLVYGTLDNEPLDGYDGQLHLGSGLPSATPRFGSTGSRPSSASAALRFFRDNRGCAQPH